MSELTKEQYDQLPDFVQGDYQEVDGAYKHAGVLKLKGSLDEVDNKYKTQLGELTERLSGFEESKKAEIEKARTDALNNAKSKTDVEEIERIHTEQMADLEKRVAERVRNEVTTEFSAATAKKDASALSSKLAAELAVDEDAQQDLEDLISLRVRPDESGKIVFYNRDGSASSMNESDFKAEIKLRHKRLVKGEVVTNGGGLTNGSKSVGSAEPKVNKAAESAKKNGDAIAHLNAHFKEALKLS